MPILHLLIDDDNIQSFVDSLDKEKVKIVEEDFESNRVLIQGVLDSYSSEKNLFIPYYDSMKDMSIWLKEKESK